MYFNGNSMQNLKDKRMFTKENQRWGRKIYDQSTSPKTLDMFANRSSKLFNKLNQSTQWDTEVPTAMADRSQDGKVFISANRIEENLKDENILDIKIKNN